MVARYLLYVLFSEEFQLFSTSLHGNKNRPCQQLGLYLSNRNKPSTAETFPIRRCGDCGCAY